MKIGEFPLLRIGGINVTIDLSWLVMFFVVAVLTEGSFAQLYPDRPTAFYWLIGGVVSVLVFLSVLVHELAHSFAAIKFGVKVTRIRLHIFGSLTHNASDSTSGRHEFIIALAGWAANIVLGCFYLTGYAYFWFAGYATPVRGVAGYLAFANFILAAIHMIPGFPLDGGRVLRAILWDRWNDIARATRVVSQLGNGLGLFFMIFGILQFLVTQNLFAALLFLVGLFMKQSAVGNFRSVVERHVLANVRIRQVMHDHVITVDWLLSVEELVREYMYKYRLTDIPVCNRDEVIGMVSLNRVKSVSKDLWTFKQVRDIMAPIEEVACTHPDADATEALQKMESEKIPCMPVMEGNRLVGIVSPNDIVKFLKIKSDLGNV
jgi:Zn-dependent protease